MLGKPNRHIYGAVFPRVLAGRCKISNCKRDIHFHAHMALGKWPLPFVGQLHGRIENSNRWYYSLWSCGWMAWQLSVNHEYFQICTCMVMLMLLFIVHCVICSCDFVWVGKMKQLDLYSLFFLWIVGAQRRQNNDMTCDAWFSLCNFISVWWIQFTSVDCDQPVECSSQHVSSLCNRLYSSLIVFILTQSLVDAPGNGFVECGRTFLAAHFCPPPWFELYRRAQQKNEINYK